MDADNPRRSADVERKLFAVSDYPRMQIFNIRTPLLQTYRNFVVDLLLMLEFYVYVTEKKTCLVIKLMFRQYVAGDSSLFSFGVTVNAEAGITIHSQS